MLDESQITALYVSDLLPDQHPDIHAAIRQAVPDLHVVPNTRDIWCRDYLPVQVAANRFIQFTYEPDYLRDAEHLRTPPLVPRGIDRVRIGRSRIKLDGGNVVATIGRAILTEKVLRENPDIPRAALLSELSDLLEAEVILIPIEPWDWIGHSDGVLRFVDANHVLRNDYRTCYPRYERELDAVLHRHSISSTLLPYVPGRGAGTNYVNFCRVRGIVLLPVYGMPSDDQAVKLIEQVFPGARVCPIDVRALALKNGVLNCVSWTID